MTRVRKSMGKWAELCKSMAKFFSRGINRTLLAVAYRERGVKQCPRIIAPLKVRIVVHCEDYLSQSMRHHIARAQAALFGNRQIEKALRQGGEQGLGGAQGCPEEVASCSGHGPVVV